MFRKVELHELPNLFAFDFFFLVDGAHRAD